MYQKYNKFINLPLFPGDNITGLGVSSSGNFLYPDYDKECVVIEFDYWGTKKTMYVPFAKYRTATGIQFGFTTYAPATIPGIGISSGDYSLFINGSNVGVKTKMPNIDMSTFKNNLSSYKADKTGRQNTDIWFNRDSTSNTIVKQCRNLKLPNLPVGYFDLPNNYELAIIWLESDNIDLCDPTAETYPGRKLGYTATNGRFYNKYHFTSSKYIVSTGAFVARCFTFAPNGCYYVGSKEYTLTTVPCRVI